MFEFSIEAAYNITVCVLAMDGDHTPMPSGAEGYKGCPTLVLVF